MAMPAILAAFEGNCNVEFLDLAYMGIDDRGASALAEIIIESQGLIEINLTGNLLTGKGAAVLADAIASIGSSSGLKRVYLSNNYLGKVGVDKLAAAASASGVDLKDLKHGNYMIEEIWNSITHGGGVVWSIVAMFMILGMCSSVGCTLQERNCIIIYSVSQMLMFLCSCLYHSFHRLTTTEFIFGVLDHAAIYILIAGTYTPFLGIHLRDVNPMLANKILWTIWILALFGVAISVFERHNVVLNRIGLILYIIMGWMVIAIRGSLFPALSGLTIKLLFAGGIAYTSGVYFFIRGNASPAHHVIWHVFVLAGSILHYFSVYNSLFGCGGRYPTASTFYGC